MDTESLKQVYWYSMHAILFACIGLVLIPIIIFSNPQKFFVDGFLLELFLNGQLFLWVWIGLTAIQISGAISYSLYRLYSGDFLKNGKQEFLSVLLAGLIPLLTLIIVSLALDNKKSRKASNLSEADSLNWIPIIALFPLFIKKYVISTKDIIVHPRKLFKNRGAKDEGRFLLGFTFVNWFVYLFLDYLSVVLGVMPAFATPTFTNLFINSIILLLTFIILPLIPTYLIKLLTHRISLLDALKVVLCSTIVFVPFGFSQFLPPTGSLIDIFQLVLILYYLVLIFIGSRNIDKKNDIPL